MVVNFKICEINRDTHKLIRIPTLIIKKLINCNFSQNWKNTFTIPGPFSLALSICLEFYLQSNEGNLPGISVERKCSRHEKKNAGTQSTLSAINHASVKIYIVFCFLPLMLVQNTNTTGKNSYTLNWLRSIE